MGSRDAYSLLMKGRELLDEGRPHRAAQVLEEASRLEPEKVSITEDLARALYNSGQTDRATEEFRRIVEAEPNNDFGYYGLGLCLARAGKVQRALGNIKLAIALKPEVERYHQTLARLSA